MADSIVFRLIQGDYIQVVEDATAKTVTLSVPALATALFQGDITQATQVNAGIIEIATNAEVQALTDPDRAVTPAGLAAVAQSSASDLTSNRLLKTGAFGLGSGIVIADGADLNAVINAGFYRLGLNNLNGIYNYGQMIVCSGSNTVAQIAFDYASASTAVRTGIISGGVGTSWTPWRSIYHTGNFDPNTKANTSGTYSGLTVGNSAQLNGQTDAMLAPPGLIAYFAGTSAPTGWLKANGAAVSRSTYANLFANIGGTYGAGNGSTTFNLPDLRGLFLRALDDGRGVDSGRGFNSVQGSQNLSHLHSASLGSVGDHQHLVYGQDNSATATGGASAEVANVQNPTDGTAYFSRLTGAAGAHTHAISIAGDGGTEARPINIALLACVKY